MYWYSCLHVGRTMLYVEDRKLDLSFLETFYRISKIFYSWKISVMLNNSLFYSKSLNADRQNKWCCFDLMLPGKSYWQAEYLQHYPPWRWWDGDMVGVLLQNFGHSPIPNNVEMIQSRWICFVTVSMVTKCCCVSFRHLDQGEGEITSIWDMNFFLKGLILRYCAQ